MNFLKLEEMTTEQKLGMIFTAYWNPWKNGEDNEKWIFDMIKKRALGSIWLQQNTKGVDEMIQKVRKAADYPILIITDAESGMGDYVVGQQYAIGCTDSEEHAYAFGKALGVTARKRGYNIVCNPVIDISVTGSMRSMGGDKERIARLAAAEIRGMHDGGILSVCKHYPSILELEQTDTHMEEVETEQTKEELLDTSLYAYVKLNEQGLLDGIMTGHEKVPKIDPIYPTSLSKAIIDVIREQGFKGFTITDALLMQGVRAAFGEDAVIGLAAAAGNTFQLVYNPRSEKNYNDLKTAFEQGVFTEEQLDSSVKTVLETQKKAYELDKTAEISEQEDKLAKEINKNSVYAAVDADVSTALPRDGKYLFVLMVSNAFAINDSAGKVDVDTFSGGWQHPDRIEKKILELFPNSKVRPVHEFPNPWHNHVVLDESANCDGVVYITFSEFRAYAGGEQLTYRIQKVLNILHKKDRIAALVHFGNPFVLEPLPHFKRVLLGGLSAESVDATLEVLAGNNQAKGKLLYDVKLK